MSELINNSQKRKDLLKHMILQLHEGEAPEEVNARMIELITPFVPTPLLDKVKAKGYLVWTMQDGNMFKSYFIKA